MKKVGASERATLFEQRRMCLETTFRQREGVSPVQWVIIAVLCVATYVALLMAGLIFVVDKLNLPEDTEKNLLILSILCATFVVFCISYMICRMINYRKAWNEFLLHGHLEMNTAIVKKVENKTIIYSEQGSVDETGKPYLIRYQVDSSGPLFRKPKEGDSILVLHGEDRWHNEITRIAIVNDALRKYVTEVNDVENWEQLNCYPHDVALHLKKEGWAPTQEQVDALSKKSLKEQKRIQLRYVCWMAVGFCIAFGVLGYAFWSDAKDASKQFMGFFIISECVALVLCVVARLGGIANMKRMMPRDIKRIQEVLYLNSIPSVERAAELCVWDEEMQKYVQREYQIKNLFIKKKKIGTVYYLMTGAAGTHLLVEKE